MNSSQNKYHHKKRDVKKESAHKPCMIAFEAFQTGFLGSKQNQNLIIM